MMFKKLQNKILVHMKTFDKPHITVLDHLLGRDKHLSVFFSEQSLDNPNKPYALASFLSALFTWSSPISQFLHTWLDFFLPMKCCHFPPSVLLPLIHPFHTKNLHMDLSLDPFPFLYRHFIMARYGWGVCIGEIQ